MILSNFREVTVSYKGRTLFGTVVSFSPLMETYMIRVQLEDSLNRIFNFPRESVQAYHSPSGAITELTKL